MIPNKFALKEESSRLILDNIEELLIEKKKLEARLKEIKELTKFDMDMLLEHMRDNNVETLPINNNEFMVEYIKEVQTTRIKGLKAILKSDSTFADRFPQYIVESIRKSHIRVSTIKD